MSETKYMTLRYKNIITEFIIIDSIKELSSNSAAIGRSYLSVLLGVFDDVMQLLSSGNNTDDMVYLDLDKVDHSLSKRNTF